MKHIKLLLLPAVLLMLVGGLQMRDEAVRTVEAGTATPIPTATPTPRLSKVRYDVMSTILVTTGAGDPSYNTDDWVLTGTHNSQPYWYSTAKSRYLYAWTFSPNTVWFFGPSLQAYPPGNPFAYSSSGSSPTPVGLSYSANSGTTGPGPTVTAACATATRVYTVTNAGAGNGSYIYSGVDGNGYTRYQVTGTKLYIQRGGGVWEIVQDPFETEGDRIVYSTSSDLAHIWPPTTGWASSATVASSCDVAPAPTSGQRWPRGDHGTRPTTGQLWPRQEKIRP